jgi:predicted O-methyltransferase YrrM
MALMNTNGNYALDDTFLKAKFDEIIKKYSINTVVETGIHEGRTTLELSYMVDKVIGVEILQEAADVTRKRLDEHQRTNVDLFVGNSPDVLKETVPTLDGDKCLFFLDAHWNNYWPINDEISHLPKNKGVIVVHDFVVPNHPELGFDSYHGQPFTYEFIKESLTEWSPNHRVEYNSQSNGSRRGVGFIYNE